MNHFTVLRTNGYNMIAIETLMQLPRTGGVVTLLGSSLHHVKKVQLM